MQLRLPTTIEGSVAATGSVTNTIAHMHGLVATREHLHLIGLGGFAALEYTKQPGSTVEGVVEHLMQLKESIRLAMVAFEPLTGISAKTIGSA